MTTAIFTQAAGEAPTSALRRRDVMSMRMAGHSFREIGEALGIDHSNAYRHYATAMARLAREDYHDADALRMLEASRLDSYLVAMMPALESGDTAAIDRAIRISERRAKLFGLDLPPPLPDDPQAAQRQAIASLSDDELLARVRRRLSTTTATDSIIEQPPDVPEGLSG